MNKEAIANILDKAGIAYDRLKKLAKTGNTFVFTRSFRINSDDEQARYSFAIQAAGAAAGVSVYPSFKGLDVVLVVKELATFPGLNDLFAAIRKAAGLCEVLDIDDVNIITSKALLLNQDDVPSNFALVAPGGDPDTVWAFAWEEFELYPRAVYPHSWRHVTVEQALTAEMTGRYYASRGRKLYLEDNSEVWAFFDGASQYTPIEGLFALVHKNRRIDIVPVALDAVLYLGQAAAIDVEFSVRYGRVEVVIYPRPDSYSACYLRMDYDHSTTPPPRFSWYGTGTDDRGGVRRFYEALEMLGYYADVFANNHARLSEMLTPEGVKRDEAAARAAKDTPNS